EPRIPEQRQSYRCALLPGACAAERGGAERRRPGDFRRNRCAPGRGDRACPVRRIAGAAPAWCAAPGGIRPRERHGTNGTAGGLAAAALRARRGADRAHRHDRRPPMSIASALLIASLLVVLTFASYIDRLYSEMGKFLALEFQENIDVWEQRIEPRLGMNRDRIALS